MILNRFLESGERVEPGFRVLKNLIIKNYADIAKENCKELEIMRKALERFETLSDRRRKGSG